MTPGASALCAIRTTGVGLALFQRTEPLGFFLHPADSVADDRTCIRMGSSVARPAAGCAARGCRPGIGFASLDLDRVQRFCNVHQDLWRDLQHTSNRITFRFPPAF